MSNPSIDPAQPDQTATDALRSTPDPVDSESLFAGSQRLLIAHNGKIYRLSKTRGGKLILTK